MSNVDKAEKKRNINTMNHRIHFNIKNRLLELNLVTEPVSEAAIFNYLCNHSEKINDLIDYDTFVRYERRTQIDEIREYAKVCQCSIEYLLREDDQTEPQTINEYVNSTTPSNIPLDQRQLIEELMISDLIASEDVFRIGEPNLYGIPQNKYYDECVDKETARKILETADTGEDVPIPGVLLFYNSDASGWIRSYLELKSGLRIAINDIQTDQDRYILARKYIREKITQRNVDESKLSNPDGGKTDESQ